MEILGPQKDYLRARYYYLLERVCRSKIESYKQIPIIINNFNRLTTLKELIASLEARGLDNIYILDNDSTYPPLLEYYKSTKYEVIYLGANLGFKALWRCKATKRRFCGDYYIYTDSDLRFDANAPADIVERMFHLMKNVYPCAFKIGPSIRIDNLPDCYDQKQNVIDWEQKYFTPVNKDNLHRAPIDTTFALYRPRVGLAAGLLNV